MVSCLLGALSWALTACALPPTLSVMTANFAASPDKYFNALVIAQDPDGDPLALSAENVPPWAHLWSQQSGSTYYAMIFGTPSASDVGLYSNIRVFASDGSSYAATPPLEITVGAPTITLLTYRPTAVINEYFSLLATATSVDGRAVDLHAENLPAWASSWTHYDGQTSWIILFGTPTAEDVGVHSPVLIVASDGKITTEKSTEIPVAIAPGNSWTVSSLAPTQNEDGSPLLDLAGYRYYVWAPNSATPVITDAGLSGLPLDVSGMATGLWKFALSAYNSARKESRLSPVLPVLVR
jgi:hypothetical protein